MPANLRFPSTTPATNSPRTAGCPKRTLTCPASFAAARMTASAKSTWPIGSSAPSEECCAEAASTAVRIDTQRLPFAFPLQVLSRGFEGWLGYQQERHAE